MNFWLNCVPPKTTAQTKRAARTSVGIRFFKSPQQQTAETMLDALLAQHRPKEPLSGLVSLTVEATWPWRKADLSTKALRASAELHGRKFLGAKPDADNFVKALMDQLVTLRFIERDEYVSELIVRKYVGHKPGIWISIEPISIEEEIAA